jgi:hypothetical protein
VHGVTGESTTSPKNQIISLATKSNVALLLSDPDTPRSRKDTILFVPDSIYKYSDVGKQHRNFGNPDEWLQEVRGPNELA